MACGATLCPARCVACPCPFLAHAHKASCLANLSWLPIPLPTPQEFLAREKQKRAEREAEKARKAAEREAAAEQAQVPAEGSSA